MSQTAKKITLITIICLFVAGNIFFAAGFFREAKLLRDKTASQQINSQVVNFLNLFIQKVLNSSAEVSFTDRLQLENSIRNLNDQQVLDQWNKFTGATTDTQIQTEAKNLLQMLVKKISN